MFYYSIKKITVLYCAAIGHLYCAVPILIYSTAHYIISDILLPQPFGCLWALISITRKNSCRVPIYYTWVERDNCGQNALSKGLRTEWDSNPRPSDYKSRVRTTTPQYLYIYIYILIHSFIHLFVCLIIYVCTL